MAKNMSVCPGKSCRSRLLYWQNPGPRLAYIEQKIINIIQTIFRERTACAAGSWRYGAVVYTTIFLGIIPSMCEMEHSDPERHCSTSTDILPLGINRECPCVLELYFACMYIRGLQLLPGSLVQYV